MGDMINMGIRSPNVPMNTTLDIKYTFVQYIKVRILNFFKFTLLIVLLREKILYLKFNF